MPRHPEIAPEIARMAGGVFSTVAHRIAGLQGEVYPLHVGDSYLEPPPGCRYQDLADAPAGWHRYGPPGGLPELIAAIAERREVGPERVLIAPGATGVLSSVLGAILEPGDEVLLLSPYWPLIPGLVHTRGGCPVDVPWFARELVGEAPDAEGLEVALGERLTQRTVAVYLNTPNNPTGRCLRAEEAEAIVRFARRHGLWILADDVYEDHVWGHPHIALRALAPERTFSVHSFSKSYAMAGTRVGYLLAPEQPGLLSQIHKVHMHSAYSAPIGPQHLALRALQTGEAWRRATTAEYRISGAAAAAALGVPEPEGGTFLFLDVAAKLDERGMQGLLEDCIDRNVLVAPGASCGRHFAGHIRLCFTAAPPQVTARGVARLAALLSGDRYLS